MGTGVTPGPQATAEWPEPSRSVSLSRIELRVVAGVLPILIVGEEFRQRTCFVLLPHRCCITAITVRWTDAPSS